MIVLYTIITALKPIKKQKAMLKNLSNFASLEVTNSEEVKGGTCYIPTPCGCGYGNGSGPSKSVKTIKIKVKSVKSLKSPKSAKSLKKCK
jgi:hypothetical protein